MKTAVITGCSGQDGTYLSEHLAKLDYGIIDINHSPGSIDLCDTEQVFGLLKGTKPQEIYHLAAFHHSSQEKLTDDLEVLKQSHNVHVLATANLLDGVRRFCPTARFFYAASSKMYGDPIVPIQDETTPFKPDSLYGITKLAGTQLCQYYRQKYKVFASVGILYNHESPLRWSHFVSKKIVEHAVAISNYQESKLVLGDLNAEIDWGYAGDYVVAMHQILQLPESDDFVISTGESHKVCDFVEEAFNLVGLDWKQYVRVDPSLLRNQRKGRLIGNHSKLTHQTGWMPTTSFHDLVKLMIRAELKKYDNI